MSSSSGADLGGGCRGCAPPPRPWDDLRFSYTTGILQKKTVWFIGVEVEQETRAPPPKKNPGSAPVPPAYTAQLHYYILKSHNPAGFKEP